MCYVVHSLFDLSRATINLKTHAHPIYERKCTESLEKMKSMVAEEVLHMPNVTSFVISLATSKTFLSHHLFNEDGEVPMELLKGEKLNQAMLMFVPLCSPNIRNLISSFKHHSRNMGSFDSILMLKFLRPYDYIQDNYFPKQQFGQKIYLFKMTVEGDGCGVDLVKRMQLGGDLENSWMMFDHVKHVQGWTTMACHVYDLVYCKIMSTAIYNMQSKDIKAQCILWRKLDAIVLNKGVRNPNFKGFMVDNAQANWNVVHIVYGIRDPIVKLIDKEHTCLFH